MTGRSDVNYQCPGSNTIPGTDPTNSTGYCPPCDTNIVIRNDGTLARHPFRYAAFLRFASRLVESCVVPGEFIADLTRTPRWEWFSHE